MDHAQIPRPIMQEHHLAAPSMEHLHLASNHHPLSSEHHPRDFPESDSDEESQQHISPPILVPRGKPEAMAVKLAAAYMEQKRHELEQELAAQQQEVVSQLSHIPTNQESSTAAPAKQPLNKPRKTAKKHSSKIKKQLTTTVEAAVAERAELLVGEQAPPLSDVEYENLDALMEQFCRVPLLSEFSRPVSLLHPEVSLNDFAFVVVTVGCCLALELYLRTNKHTTSSLTPS
jgi:hypothetical protein